MSNPAIAATDLRAALAEFGLSRTYQTDADGMSTVSVWANLTVWCAGAVFFWRAGPDFTEFTIHQSVDPAGAAIKIKERYDELRQHHDALELAKKSGT